MAEAEMTIRLVDATAEEQAALDNTPAFNNDGPVPPPVQAPPTDTRKSTEANAKEGRATDAPSSRWTEAMQRLKDALLHLSERFAPKAFQEPIERLINALAPKDEQGNTLVPPPVQTDVETKPMVDHVTPTEPNQEKESHGKKHEPTWIEKQLKKSHFGREVLESYEHTKHNLQKGIDIATNNPLTKKAFGAAKRWGKSFAQSKAGQKLGGFAKTAVTAIGKKAGFAKTAVTAIAQRVGIGTADAVLPLQ
jgi:hypothetical protein